MSLSNKIYDALKFFALIALPGIGTAYFALGQLWGIPHTAEVVGTITIVDTLLGILLRVNTTLYNNSSRAYVGEVEVTGYDDLTGHPDVRLTLDPEKLAKNDVARLKVTGVRDTPRG